jgi:hypothetical protein
MAEKGKRGFAGMDAEKQRQIASKGGKAAHQKGRAHEFTSEEAREAGRKARHGAQRTTAPQPAPQEAARVVPPPTEAGGPANEPLTERHEQVHGIRGLAPSHEVPVSPLPADASQP